MSRTPSQGLGRAPAAALCRLLGLATAFAFSCAAAATEAPRRPAASASAAEPALGQPRSRAIDYVAPPRYAQLSINPSNTHVAFIYTNDDEQRVLAVAELARPGEMRPLASVRNADIVALHWINDRRLLYTATSGELMPTGASWGSFAVDIDGQRARKVFTQAASGLHRRPVVSRADSLGDAWFLLGRLHDRGDEILVGEVDTNSPTTRRLRSVARFDTYSGLLTTTGIHMPDGTSRVLTDADGVVIAVVAVQGDRERLFHQPAGSREWTLLEDSAALDDEGIHPLYVEADGQWVVLTRRGRDTHALTTYDPRQRRLAAEPLLAVDGHDASALIDVDDSRRLVVGASVMGDRLHPVWFDEQLLRAQQAVDAALPAGRSNLLLCGRCLGARHFGVVSYSDHQPPEYWLYDATARRMQRLGSTRPGLATQPQGRRTAHRVPARDGLVLPVYVTHPPGAAPDEPRPTVMRVHGGPWLRGASTHWESETAFLASRGFRVIEVEFRGSTGFGARHFRAGWRQWGQAMQDDLADVMAWAGDRKMATPGRACIEGSSYGGYAALMGLVRHPALWRCAVSLAGVTDLEKLFKWSWTDVPEGARRYSMPQLLGDPRADAAMLRQHSPLHRAAEIKAPVLLGHGSLDSRVDPAHSERFAKAARAAGAAVQLVPYEAEGHGFFLAKNQADWLERVAAFLEQHLADER